MTTSDIPAMDLFDGEPSIGSWRIVPRDRFNVVAQCYETISPASVGKEGPDRDEWVDRGFYGDLGSALRGIEKKVGWTADSVPDGIHEYIRVLKALARAIKDAVARVEKAVGAHA